MTQADSVHSTPPTNTSAETPLGDSEKPQDSLYLPTDTTPEQLFRAIGKLRKDARDEIDRLIRFLDETDNHMELEDSIDDNPQGDDELDGPENGEDEESDPPEASLGSLDGRTDQTGWASGDRRDLELDPSDSGIADHDGLLEQIGSQDWQGPRGGMI